MWALECEGLGLEQRGWVRGFVTSQSGKMLTVLHFVRRTVFSFGKEKWKRLHIGFHLERWKKYKDTL